METSINGNCHLPPHVILRMSHQRSQVVNRSNPNLILKHEILSQECDVFRASLPRRIYVARLVRLGGLIVLAVAGCVQMIEDLKLSVGIITIIAWATIYILTRTIEERILFIKGLGIQYSKLNGLHQETCCNFYPLESVNKFYVFESVDGLKYGHFLNIQLTNDKTNIVLFEDMKPPVEFLKRIYRKYEEIKLTQT